MITQTQAIKNFLTDYTISDLASLYTENMEVQVLAAQDNGEPVSGFTNRSWRGYTDGIATWKSIRIPYNASTKPEYTDKQMSWDLSQHAEAVGMTGWDWKHKKSLWVAFDFDSIVNHTSAGLTAEELKTVQDSATSIPWVTVRKSTSGQGLHLYVFLTPTNTDNHTEHSALARSILGKMCAITGYDFNNKVDVCGGNIWVWHRKMKGTDGLTIIKSGSILDDIPLNWKDHVSVIKGRSKIILPKGIKEPSLFEQLTSAYPKIPLDTEHRKLIAYLEEHEYSHYFDQDQHLLVTHTYALKRAHTDLKLKGIFETLSTGKEGKQDQNAFACPLPHPQGAWSIRRFSPGVQEASTWTQDGAGWTTCQYNIEPSLSTAARSLGGMEDEKGNFHFLEAEVAATVAQKIGTEIKIPDYAASRKTTIKQHKDGQRIIVSIKKGDQDDPKSFQGWREEKGCWQRLYYTKTLKSENINTKSYDHLIRHLVSTDGQDQGWVIRSNDEWHSEPLGHIKIAIKALGLEETEAIKAMGQCVSNPWIMVNKPFKPEYPGNREWNRDAVQLRFSPLEGDGPFVHPNWDKLINHIGVGLDLGVEEDGWCRANGIITGGDYLRLWVASLFQNPFKHLPYLFLYSPEQQTGKTSLHEALKLLITSKGYMDVKSALINQSGFNAEMANAIICAADEIDLRQNKNAYNRIKDWITGLEILIHQKGRTPYMIKNTAHFIHTGNDPNECPIQTADSRIVVIRVPVIDPLDMIPKDTFFHLLEKEAASFLATIFSLEIPKCSDRLSIPVIGTEAKEQSAKLNRNELELFIEEVCYYAPGQSVRVSEFWDRFNEWLDPSSVHAWSKIRMNRSLPAKHPKGRLVSDLNQFHIGNISFIKPDTDSTPPYILIKDNLVLE
jgi:hypothetical protein